ncbi:MAG: DUF4276 family protein [Azospirillum sp.]|nr:DUF4276 family protein [Azospirillum sp.]
MAISLEKLLLRLFPSLSFLCIAHEGKADLLRSIPRKLRAWQEPGARFAVLIDNDGRDCREVKRELGRLCAEAGRGETLVRIVCQELEAWYLGDPEALASAFGDESLRRLGQRSQFREPDAITKPSAQLSRLVPAFQKSSGARSMADHIERHRNNSRSFRTFMAGIERIVREVELVARK